MKTLPTAGPGTLGAYDDIEGIGLTAGAHAGEVVHVGAVSYGGGQPVLR